MRLLLDTHNFLWLISGDERLPESLLKSIRSEKHMIESLNLDEASVSHLAKLPPIHRDPFDRMLICQALQHDLTVVTVDNALASYPVPVLMT